MNIEEFYAANLLDPNFDENFYEQEYPETKNFYQPYCEHHNISNKYRLYFHWIKYGLSRFYKNYQDKIAANNPEEYYKDYPDTISNEILLICNIYSGSSRYKDLLPHFINYYISLGINTIIFICDESVKNYILSLNLHTEQLSFVVYEDGSMVKPRGHNGTNDSIRINTIKKQKQSWYVVADLDEFHDISPYESFTCLIDVCVHEKAYFVKSVLLDRMASTGVIPKHIDNNIPIIQQFPTIKNITKDIMLADSSKCILMHHSVDVLAGHHSVYNSKNLKAFSQTFVTNHYKWFGEVLSIEEFKMNERKKIGFDYYKEQERLLYSNLFNAKNKKLFFTIVDSSFKKEALICIKNAMKYNKDCDYIAVITDMEFEPFVFNGITFNSLLEIKDEIIPTKYRSNNNVLRWSLKPVMIEHFLQIYDKVIYVDPDILFINYWHFLFDDITGVLLTKHNRSLYPGGYQYAINFTDGFFNAGFIGASKKGIPAINWWKKAVEWKCEKNFTEGLFDDQKYLDIMTLEYFNLVNISQHKGCNIAPWNSKLIETYCANKTWYLKENNSPVIFIHLTKNSYSSPDPILSYHCSKLERKKIKYDKFNSMLIELAKTRESK
jgi:hypothetical protein